MLDRNVNFIFLTTSKEMFETPGLLSCYLPGCKRKQEYTPTLLYHGIFCIAAFAYHVNGGVQCPLAIVYVWHLSRQTSNT